MQFKVDDSIRILLNREAKQKKISTLIQIISKNHQMNPQQHPKRIISGSGNV